MVGDGKVVVFLCKEMKSSWKFNWHVIFTYHLAIIAKEMQSSDGGGAGIGYGSVGGGEGMAV